MNLKPSRWLSGPMKGWVAGAERGSLWLELEVISPASSVGRKAHLYLSEEDVTEVLKVLKERASYTRRHPMGAGEVMDAVSWETDWNGQVVELEQHRLSGADLAPVGDFDMATLWRADGTPDYEAAEQALSSGSVRLLRLAGAADDYA